MKLVLHIGLHKTGSTAIQNTIFDDLETVRAAGLDYLDVHRNHSIPLFSLFGHAPHQYKPNVIQGIDTPEKVAVQNERLRRQITNAITGSSAETFIISGEDISLLPREGVVGLKTFLEPFFDTIRVLAYVREPVPFISSFAQEGMKAGWTLKGLYESPPAPQIRWRLEKFYDIFGDIDVRLFERDHNKSWDAVDDFLSYIGKPDLDLKKTQLGNETVSVFGAKVLNALNIRYPYTVDGKFNPERGKNAVNHIVKLKGDRFSFPLDRLSPIEDQIAADCEWLADKTGIKLNSPSREYSGSIAPPADPDTISIGVAEVINDLCRRWERNVAEVRRLTAQKA